jgi:hypothetical protein
MLDRFAPVFSVALRDALGERPLRLAKDDERVVAGAAVGSLAVDGGDRFSDLDLTFGIADDVPVADVLRDWTRTLVDELAAVHLADLERGPTTYRVFLLPDALQFDLSMTPAAQFRPAGPRFRLLFGETAARDAEAPTPPDAKDLFGWGVIYALHASACPGSRLRRALAESVSALLSEGAEAGLPHAETVAGRLAELSARP